MPEKITYNAKYGLSTSFTRVLQPCDFLELVVHPVVYQARLPQLVQLLTEPERMVAAGVKLLLVSPGGVGGILLHDVGHTELEQALPHDVHRGLAIHSELGPISGY